MNEFPKILYREDGEHEEDQHIVLLSQQFHDMKEVRATLTPFRVTLTRLSETDRPRNFRLTHTEMDALCTAWENFKADRMARAEEIKAKIEAEDKRLQAVYDQAIALRDTEVPGLTIEVASESHGLPMERTYYNVYLPDYFAFRRTALGVDDLLSAVRNAIEIHKRLEEEAQEALKLATMVKNLRVERDAERGGYHVTYGQNENFVRDSHFLDAIKNSMLSRSWMLAKRHSLKLQEHTDAGKRTWTFTGPAGTVITSDSPGTLLTQVENAVQAMQSQQAEAKQEERTFIKNLENKA